MANKSAEQQKMNADEEKVADFLRTKGLEPERFTKEERVFDIRRLDKRPAVSGMMLGYGAN